MQGAATSGSATTPSGNGKLRYRLGGCVGEGATGKVYVGLNVNTGELLAVKRIHFDNITRDELAAIEQEILLLQKLRHQHIVSYMAIDITDTNLNILMEFCPGGSVAHLLKAFGPLEEDVLRAYTRQILDGIHFLHENQAVHRDIKGANVLVAHNGILKIADFGATMMLSGQKTMTEDGKQIQGTPYWMAPEVRSRARCRARRPASARAGWIECVHPRQRAWLGSESRVLLDYSQPHSIVQRKGGLRSEAL